MSLGPPELGILLGMLVLVPLFLVVPVIAAIDAGAKPEQAFDAAGTSKTLWIVLPLAGMVACGIVGLGAAIYYYASIRPKVVAQLPR